MDNFDAVIVRQGLWFSVLRYISFAVNFFGQLVLVRFLFPDDFGQYAITVGLIEIVCAFTLSGIQNAAIRYQNLPFVSENSFGLAIVAAGVTILISLGILVSSQVVFDFDNANSAFLILTLSKAIQGFSSVYSAHLLKDMNFLAIGIADIISNLVGMAIALTMALMGFGFLSLVYREVVTIWVKLLWLRNVAKIKLTFRFDLAVIKQLLFFIKSILILSVSSVFVYRAPSIVFGVFETKMFVGLYDRTYYLAGLPNTLLSPILSNFSFTLFSNISEDTIRIKKILDFKFFLLARIILPVFVVLNFHSELVVLLLGPNWQDITGLVRHFSLLAITLPLLTVTTQYMLSINKIWQVMSVSLCALSCLFLSYIFYKLGGTELTFVLLAFSSSLFIGTLWVISTLCEGFFVWRCCEIFMIYLLLLIFPDWYLHIVAIFILVDIVYSREMYIRIYGVRKLFGTLREK